MLDNTGARIQSNLEREIQGSKDKRECQRRQYLQTVKLGLRPLKFLKNRRYDCMKQIVGYMILAAVNISYMFMKKNFAKHKVQ